jgi:U3 small nucleolar RNA-associated protein 20
VSRESCKLNPLLPVLCLNFLNQGILIKTLIGRIKADGIDKMFKILDAWFLKSDNPPLQRAAAQVYGLVAQVIGQSKLSKLVPTLLENFGLILKLAIEEVEELMSQDSVDLNDSMDLARWESAYYSLVSFGKVLVASPSVITSTHALPIWICIKSLLLHPHNWIRSQCSKLYSALFAHIKVFDVNTMNECTSTLFGNQVALYELSVPFINQMTSDLVSEELYQISIENLVLLGKGIISMEHVKESEDSGKGFCNQLMRIFKKFTFMSRGDLGTSKRPWLVRIFDRFY